MKPIKYPVHIDCIEKSTEHLKLNFNISPDLYWFKGHFTEYPILPGVAQIDWVINLFQQYTKQTIVFSGIEMTKFQEPIRPNDDIELYISLTKKTLYFEYKKQNANLKSKGKITIS